MGAGCKAAGCEAAGLQAAGLQAEGIEGCKGCATGCRVAGCKGCATGCRVDLGSLPKGVETLYCCILRFKIRYASRVPALATNETLIFSQHQRLNRAELL